MPLAHSTLPLYGSQAEHAESETLPVPASFPSPTADYVESELDLNELCIRRPAASYFVRFRVNTAAIVADNSNGKVVI